MKKIILLLLVLLLTITVMAVAESVTPLDLFGIEDPAPAPYDWAALGTIAGATAMTLLIVQYLKLPLDKVGHIPTRALVYIIALLILLGAQAFTAGLSADTLPLILVNAFVVALAAMGAYEATFAKMDARSLEPPM